MIKIKKTHKKIINDIIKQVALISVRVEETKDIKNVDYLDTIKCKLEDLIRYEEECLSRIPENLRNSQANIDREDNISTCETIIENIDSMRRNIQNISDKLNLLLSDLQSLV